MSNTAFGFEPDSEEGTVTEGTTGLFPDTPAPTAPAPKPQAHRVRVTGVTEGTWPSGDKNIQISLTSLETGSDFRFTLNPPTAYINNVLVDPSTLSDEETINENGNTVPSERVQYARSVRNSGKDGDSNKKGGYFPNTTQYIDAGNPVPGDGTIETLARFAIEQGHTVTAPMPRTFTQLVTYLNNLTTGVECVALLKAKGDFLNVQRLVSTEYASQERVLKGYRRLWSE
jgi:hypothetical protein